MSAEINAEVRVGRPAGNALAEGYVAGSEAVTAFYGGHWTDPGAYREKAREVAERFDPATLAAVADAIHAPDDPARARLERVVEEDGLVVTTGQQPVLFGGPLYTLYKALTAVALADTLQDLLERPVLPLFWVASEDHDWDEAGHTHLIDLDNDLRRIEVPVAEGESRPVHRVELGEGLQTAREAFETLLPETDFSGPFLDLLRESYPAGSTLSGGFRRLMAGLLASLPLAFVDAAHPLVKERSRPVLLGELDAADEHEALLTREAARLEEAGYPVQVPILEGGVNLFLEGPGGRERIYRDDGSFHLRHSGLPLDRDEILRRVEADPAVLSPNVLLRPVVESAVFPVVSYVAGPGEIAYYAQLSAFFEAHGIRMPVIHPRFSATLLEGKVAKVLEKFGLEPEAMQRPHHELVSELAREEMPDEVRRALGEIRGALGQGTARLLDAAREVDPTLKGPITHARNESFSAFNEAEKKIVQAVKRQDEIALAQLEKARVHLHPLGRPQERVVNPFYYLVRYGPDFLKSLRERFVVEME